MKKILIIVIGIFLLLNNIKADEIEVKVPLDIDGLPNNNNVITNSDRNVHVRYISLKFEMHGCNEERIFRKWLPLSSAGIHETITVRKTFVTECGNTDPQITVHLYFSEYDVSNGYPASSFSTGKSSLKSLIISNTNAVRGYF